MFPPLTSRQREVYDYLLAREHRGEPPLTLDGLCSEMGVRSRGSMHKHIQALVHAGLLEPLAHKKRGLRVASAAGASTTLPFLGYIAAGRPIEAVEQREELEVPPAFLRRSPCYVLEVRGDSMIDDGILDGDRIIIEQRQVARNGEIVVAIVDDSDATLKRFEETSSEIVLHPANDRMSPLHYAKDRVKIQGVLAGLIRVYT